MKKFYSWPIIAGILGGIISQDPCFGSISGCILGAIVGIPLYLLLSFAAKILFKNEAKAKIVAISISCMIILVGQWFIYHPPASLLFKFKITNPIPATVKNIKAKSVSIGPDGSSYLKFNISKSDLDKILKEKNFEKVKIDIYSDKDNGQISELSEIHNYLNIPNDLPWFKVTDIRNSQVYVIDKLTENGTYECIIYDPTSHDALYKYHKI